MPARINLETHTCTHTASKRQTAK